MSQQARTNGLERIETPAAALTLTRTATLAITTAGTTITWQSATRNTGFTWATTDITIPTAGYYAVQVSYNTVATITNFIQLVLNGVNVGYFGASWTIVTLHHGTLMRYFTTGDVIQIRALPSANTTINVNAETALAASPFLHIVQLTRPVL